MQPIYTCLWFDDQGLEAASFYVGVFPNSRILDIKYYLEGGPRPAGSVLTVLFELNGVAHLALNGGPVFKFSPAMSLVANCDTQQEIDELWRRLSEGGQQGQCGWLTDRFGVSWQIVPRALTELLNSADASASQRVFSKLMKMTKLDIGALRRAYENG